MLSSLTAALKEAFRCANWKSTVQMEADSGPLVRGIGAKPPLFWCWGRAGFDEWSALGKTFLSSTLNEQNTVLSSFVKYVHVCLFVSSKGSDPVSYSTFTAALGALRESWRMLWGRSECKGRLMEPVVFCTTWTASIALVSQTAVCCSQRRGHYLM